MAENPIKTPLTTDLPEDWTAGQIVAPDGASVGLSEQHGYNYLMQKVNEARRAVNTIGESFETIGGKRTCRFTVGTSAAGWTAADCDYLCDGTDDQAEINQAVTDLPSSGGEIVLLSGEYHLTGAVLIAKYDVTLRGNGNSTVLIRETADGSGAIKCVIAMGINCVLRDFAYNGGGHAADGIYEIAMTGGGAIQNISFTNCEYGCIYVEGTGGTGRMGEIVGCTCYLTGEFIHVKSGARLSVRGNLYGGINGIFLKTMAGSNVQLFALGNMGVVLGPRFVLDGLDKSGGSILCGNMISTLEILNTENVKTSNSGNIISGNIFCPNGDPGPSNYAVLLGENTNANFVTGNMLVDGTFGTNFAIRDLGTDNIVRFNSDDLGGSTPATVAQATPVLAVSAEGQVTATAVQQAGYVAAGTKNAALTLSEAQDADFIPENIKKGVTIFGVEGQLETGGAAGVESFNGRTGAVAPAQGDYTAAMVGARASDWTPSAVDVGAIPAGDVQAIQALTEEEYNALTEKSAATLYLIKE